MNAAKDSDILLEIKHEYKAKKKQLEKYNKFIDRHQGFAVGSLLFLCSICVFVILGITRGTNTGYSVIVRVVVFLSFVLLVATIVIAFITGIRKSTKGKIEKQLAALKDEAVAFQRYARNHNDITRDELGLWRDIEKVNNVNSHHKAIGIFVIVAVISMLTIPFAISLANTKKQEAIRQESQVRRNQAQCLNDAYASYEAAWKAADKDGNGSVLYKDGATDIAISYYDSIITCYRIHKTEDSDSYIADYQTKRQQEVDKYTAWLESSKQPTYMQIPSNSYSSGMSCMSSSVGSSVYTHCY